MATPAKARRKLALKQLDDAFDEYDQTMVNHREYPREDPRSPSIQDWVRSCTRSRAAIHRVAPGSTYDIEAQKPMDSAYESIKAERLIGIVQALRADVAAGYTDSLAERIHGELFSNFLEMAQHLLDDGFEHAAAVIAGSSLEAHLRQMCNRAGIDVEFGDPPRPKKTEAMNTELVKADAYSKLEQKDVTAWLGLRNSAAHGKYGEYNAAQVRLMIAGIREFISRHPA